MDYGRTMDVDSAFSMPTTITSITPQSLYKGNMYSPLAICYRQHRRGLQPLPILPLILQYQLPCVLITRFYRDDGNELYHTCKHRCKSRFSSGYSKAIPPTWAIASVNSTPGITGLPGK